jgi:hypothetical protein
MSVQFQLLCSAFFLDHRLNSDTQGESLVTPAEALAFVCAHGLALEAGTGPVPSLAAAIAGAPIRGNWWAHARGREIFAVTRAIRCSPDVLVCRLVGGKITYVHRRLWPALVKLSERFSQKHLAQIREVHTASGKHVVDESPFPTWVSRELAAQASDLDEKSALRQLGPWCMKNGSSPNAARSIRRSP